MHAPPPSLPAPPTATVITGIRWEQGTLAISTTGPLAARLMTMHAPERVVVDLLGAELADPTLAQPLSIGMQAVRDIRVGAHPESDSVRFVLDCSRPLDFALAEDPTTHRILLTEAGATPPLPPWWQGAPSAPAVALAHRAANGQPATVASTGLRYGPFLPASVQPLLPVQVSWRSGPHYGTLYLHAAQASILHPLSWQISQQQLPTRLTIRLARSELQGFLPEAREIASAIDARRDGPDEVVQLTLRPCPGPGGTSCPYGLLEHVLDGDRTLALTLYPQPTPVGYPVVVLDPGHGGTDPGAIGPSGTHEADDTLMLARRLKQVLWKRYRIASVLTRTADEEMDLQPRVDTIDMTHARLLVSLHCNAYTDPHTSGLETYFRNPGSAAFARVVHRCVLAATGRADRGIKQARLYVLRHPGIPSILVESGFITSPSEEQLLASKAYQLEVAGAIAEGIHRYLSQTGELGFSGPASTSKVATRRWSATRGTRWRAAAAASPGST